MKRTKKLLSIILSICVLFSITTGLDFSAYAISSSGSCGTNVKYTFNSSTGELVINGTGAMTNYSSSSSPFYNQSGIKTVVINSGVTSIGYNAFKSCKGLTSVTIGNSVTRIENYAFDYCTGLTNIIISNSVTLIGDYAFDDCTGLTNIIIPNSVTSICDGAFCGCTGLTSITIPNSITNIGDRAFSSCSNLTSIIVDKDNKIYDSRNNCNAIIEASTNSLIVGCKNTVIPNSVTRIGDDAFERCTGLTSVTIPDSVTSIGPSAFYGCTGLTSITIPNSVTSIGNSAFCGCTGLTSVTIPDSVTSIGNGAFEYCTGLTNVTIGNSVTSIGDYAFWCCDHLQNVYYIGSENKWKNIKIGSDNDCLTNATIHYHNHIYSVVNKLDKTCSTDGYIIYGCECGKEYKEIYKAGHEYILLDVIEPDCENVGINIYECIVCGDSLIEEPSALGHNMVVDNAVAPTCTETGLTQGIHCSRCGMVEVKQEIIESYGGHSFTNYISDENATCLEDGTKTAKCDRCDETKTIADIDSKLGHSYVATITKPTCTEQGYTTYNCSRCEDSYISDYTEALGHTSKVINAVAPTCTETGLSEGSSCSVCGVVLIEQQIISANGHSYELYRTTATCEKAGYNVYKCSVCSGTKSEKVDAHHTCDTFVGVVDGELNYSCSACGKEYTQSASEIFEKWDSSAINASAEEYPELDVVNDGIINAKDYALLNHIKNYGY